MNRKLTKEEVLEIRELLKKGEIALDIAEKFKVAPNTISDIKRERTWKYVSESVQ